MMRRLVDIGWLAGIIEGEGSLEVTKDGRPAITVTMTDEDVVRRCHMVAGVGHVNGPYDRIPGRKPLWSWKVGRSADVVAIAMTIYPLLGERRRERVRRQVAAWRSMPGVGRRRNLEQQPPLAKVA